MAISEKLYCTAWLILWNIEATINGDNMRCGVIKKKVFHCQFWSTVDFGFLFILPGIISNCFPFFFCLARKSNLPVLHEEELLLCSKRCERLFVQSAHIPTDTHTNTHRQTSLASTCRQCGEEIRLHQMHNAVLISMPTNLTQSKKVTLCRNQKEASLFQNCMLGSLQADRFNEWDSLKRNVFHLWLTTSCSKQNWKTILISDHCNGSDTSVWKGNFFVSFQKSGLGSLSCMAKVHPLHTGVGVNLILSAACHAFQTQSVAFVRLCGSVRHDKQGNNWNLWGWWVDFTAFLWLSVMTVKMGALEGVFDVFVLFRAGSGSPLHALMSCCGVWCWPSNLLWRSGPGVHPSILPLSHTVSITHAGGYSLIYIASRKRAASLSCCRWWNGEECAPMFVCFFMFVWTKGKVETEYVTSLCVCMHMYMNVDRVTLILTVRTAN